MIIMVLKLMTPLTSSSRLPQWVSSTCEDDLNYLVYRDDDIDFNDLVIMMLLMSDEDPTHLLLQAASVGEWHHGYHVGNDVDQCVCNCNGVELDDSSQLLLQAASEHG